MSVGDTAGQWADGIGTSVWDVLVDSWFEPGTRPPPPGVQW